jgi:uncharacterized protein (TIGR00730 family)
MHKLNESEKRVFRNICKELHYSLKEMQTVKKAISLFGSARLDQKHPYCKQTEAISELLSASGYDIITGGGGGIMESANKGAKYTESIGLSIILPEEQFTNSSVSKEVKFKYFAIRKIMFIKYAKAFIACPGGFGTMDELFEVLTLIQTKVIKPMPVILVNKEYWNGMIEWFKNTLIKEHTISKKELDLINIVDTPEEVLEAIQK